MDWCKSTSKSSGERVSDPSLQVNFFFSYGVKFFASAGIKDSFLIQVILSAVNVLSTFPGLWAVENLGRRKTLFIGAAIMFVGQVVAGALGTACTSDATPAGRDATLTYRTFQTPMERSLARSSSRSAVSSFSDSPPPGDLSVRLARSDCACAAR